MDEQRSSFAALRRTEREAPPAHVPSADADALSRRIKALEDRLGGAEALQQRVSELEQRLSQARQEAAAAEERLKQRDEALRALRLEFDADRQGLASQRRYEAVESQLRDQAAATRRLVERVEAVAAAVDRRDDGADAALAEIRRDVAELAKRAAADEERLRLLRSEYDELNARRASWEAASSDAARRLEEAMAARAEAAGAEAREARERLDLEAAAFEGRFEELRRRVDETGAWLAKLAGPGPLAEQDRRAVAAAAAECLNRLAQAEARAEERQRTLAESLAAGRLALEAAMREELSAAGRKALEEARKAAAAQNQADLLALRRIVDEQRADFALLAEDLERRVSEKLVQAAAAQRRMREEFGRALEEVDAAIKAAACDRIRDFKDIANDVRVPLLAEITVRHQEDLRCLEALGAKVAEASARVGQLDSKLREEMDAARRDIAGRIATAQAALETEVRTLFLSRIMRLEDRIEGMDRPQTIEDRSR